MKINSSITRGVLTPLFYEDPLYCLPLFQILPTPSFFVASNPQPHSSLSCLVSLVEWVIVPHLMCYFNDIMSSPDILVPEEPWCVIFATRCQVCWGLTHNVLFFSGTLIWYHNTNTYKHTQYTQGPVDWNTHINIYLHHLLCAHSSYLYYIEWIIYRYQKFTFHNIFSFQKLFISKSHISVH